MGRPATLLMVLLAAPTGSGSGTAAPSPPSWRQVRWFVADLVHTQALVSAHPRSLTGLYPGFSAAGMHDNGSFFPSPDAGSGRRDRQASIPCDGRGNLLAPYAWATAFRPLGLTVEPVIDVSAVALSNGTAHLAIPALVRCAVQANITGYMVDFESFGSARPPHFRGGAPELALIYTAWLQKFGTALHAAGKTLAVCVSDYGVLGEYSAGYGNPAIDTVMTMATYYNMANQSRHASIGPLPSWDNVEQLWAQWLLVPQIGPPRPPAAKQASCAAALRTANCTLGGGSTCAACLQAAYHQLVAAKCSPWPCPGPHSSACFADFTTTYCAAEGTPISLSALSAGVGTMTTAGCGCQNGTRGCCDHIVSPLTDKAFAAQPDNFPPPCRALGCTGNCFFWTQPALQRFVDWCAGAAKLHNIDVYRSDYGALEQSQRQTEPYFFGILERFLGPAQVGAGSPVPAPTGQGSHASDSRHHGLKTDSVAAADHSTHHAVAARRAAGAAAE
eukprot:COSAG01_NODE_461_length_16698_cov_113.458160_8_plen_502_part_00